MAHANDEYLDVDGNPLKKGAYYNLVDNNNKKINIFGYLGKNGNLKYQFTGHGAVTFKYINANGLNKGLRGISINTNPRFILIPEIVDTDNEDEDNDSEDDLEGGKRMTNKRMSNKRMSNKRMSNKRMSNKRTTKKRMTNKRMTNKRRIIKT
ncbi:hypothetical protein EBU24_05120 [bacterium]|nr:hypothetical protein [bacterium]